MWLLSLEQAWGGWLLSLRVLCSCCEPGSHENQECNGREGEGISIAYGVSICRSEHGVKSGSGIFHLLLGTVKTGKLLV